MLKYGNISSLFIVIYLNRIATNTPGHQNYLNGLKRVVYRHFYQMKGGFKDAKDEFIVDLTNKMAQQN